MKIKIFSWKALAKAGQYGFNVVFQPEFLDHTDTAVPLCQFLVIGMRVVYSKIYPPARLVGDQYVNTVFFDRKTAEALYHIIEEMQEPPVLLPIEEAIKPLLISDKVIEKYAK